MVQIRSGGLDVEVETRGGGPPLLLLHGILCDIRAWSPQLESLSDSFQVTACDLPGCGQTDDPPGDWRFDEYADWLGGLIEDLGLDRPVLVGLSWGAVLGIAFEGRHPGLTSGLVLAGAYAGWAGSLTPEERDERLAGALAQSEQPPDAWVPRWMPGLLTSRAPQSLVEAAATMVEQFHPAGFRVMARAVAEADLRPVLSGIRAPVQLVYGEHDERSPTTTVGADLAAQIEGAEFEVIRDAGHVCNLEHPDEFNRVVRDFAGRVFAQN